MPTSPPTKALTLHLFFHVADKFITLGFILEILSVDTCSLDMDNLYNHISWSIIFLV